MPPSPEQPNATPPPAPPQRKSKYLFILLGVLVAVLLLGIASVFAFHLIPQTQKEASQEDLTLKFPEWNFSFTRDASWKVLNEQEISAISLPPHVKGITAALQKGECTFAFLAPGQLNMDSVFTYLGVPTSVPSLSSGTKYSEGYALADSLQPPGFKWDPNIQQHFPGEMMVAEIFDRSLIRRLQPDNPYFVLFDDKSGLVDPNCASEISTMVSTLAPYYERATLNSESEGALYLKEGKLLFVDDKNIPEDTGENLAYTTVNNPNGIVPVPFVYKNKIWYATDSALNEYDPFTAKLSVHPISSIGYDFTFPKGDTIYLFTNSKCNNQTGECRFDIVNFSVTTGATTTLPQQGCVLESGFSIDVSVCKDSVDYTSASTKEIESAIAIKHGSGSMALVKGGVLLNPQGDEKTKWEQMIEWQASAWSFPQDK